MVPASVPGSSEISQHFKVRIPTARSLNSSLPEENLMSRWLVLSFEVRSPSSVSQLRGPSLFRTEDCGQDTRTRTLTAVQVFFFVFFLELRTHVSLGEATRADQSAAPSDRNHDITADWSLGCDHVTVSRAPPPPPPVQTAGSLPSPLTHSHTTASATFLFWCVTIPGTLSSGGRCRCRCRCRWPRRNAGAATLCYPLQSRTEGESRREEDVTHSHCFWFSSRRRRSPVCRSRMRPHWQWQRWREDGRSDGGNERRQGSPSAPAQELWESLEKKKKGWNGENVL